MTKVILVFLTIVMGLVFTVTPRGPKVQWFPLSDQEYYIESYFYHLWQHAIIIVLSKILKDQEQEYRLFFKAFFWFNILDTADYVLTCNYPWMPPIGWFEVSFNTIGPICLTLIGIYEIRRNSGSDSF